MSWQARVSISQQISGFMTSTFLPAFLSEPISAEAAPESVPRHVQNNVCQVRAVISPGTGLWCVGVHFSQPFLTCNSHHYCWGVWFQFSASCRACSPSVSFGGLRAWRLGAQYSPTFLLAVMVLFIPRGLSRCIIHLNNVLWIKIRCKCLSWGLQAHFASLFTCRFPCLSPECCT